MYLEPWRYVAFVPGGEDDGIKVLSAAVDELNTIVLRESVDCWDHLQNLSLDTLVGAASMCIHWVHTYVLTNDISLGLFFVLFRDLCSFYSSWYILRSQPMHKCIYILECIIPTAIPWFYPYSSFFWEVLVSHIYLYFSTFYLSHSSDIEYRCFPRWTLDLKWTDLWSWETIFFSVSKDQSWEEEQQRINPFYG